MDDLEKRETYASARKIADLWFETVAEEAAAGSYISCGDRRRETVNPFYGRTKSGLYIEWYYGGPSEVYTPWGKWNFSGGLCHSGLAAALAVSRFLRKIDATIHTPKHVTKMGEFGPIFEVKAIGGVPTPLAEMANQRENGDLYATNRDEWARLTAEYEATKAAAE